MTYVMKQLNKDVNYRIKNIGVEKKKFKFDQTSSVDKSKFRGNSL